MTGSRRGPSGPGGGSIAGLPPWAPPRLGEAAKMPCLARDAARSRELEKILASAMMARLPGGLALDLLSGIRGPADLPFALAGVGDPASGEEARAPALVLLPAHAPPVPFAADPYDGSAFEVARRMRDLGREPEVLATGLWGAPARARVAAGRLFELARFAYELRRSLGIAPRRIALLGGIAPSWWRRGDPLGVAGWRTVGDAAARWVGAFGLAVDRLGVDVGSTAEAWATGLAVEVVAEGSGWEATIACDAPAALLALVRPGPVLAPPLEPGAARFARLVSAPEPGRASLPRIALSEGPAPSRLLLPLRRVPAGLPTYASS